MTFIFQPWKLTYHDYHSLNVIYINLQKYYKPKFDIKYKLYVYVFHMLLIGYLFL